MSSHGVLRHHHHHHLHLLHLHLLLPLLLLLLLLLLLTITAPNSALLSDAFRFDVSSGIAPKCLSEYIHPKALVLAHYRVLISDEEHEHAHSSSSSSSSDHTVSLKVSSPSGRALHHAESVLGGEFGFTTVESGTYVACFWLPSPSSIRSLSVELDWKMGIAAKDWDSVARKDKIEGVELELMRVHGAIETIRDNLMYLREKEIEMRNVNEKTNTLIARLGIASLLMCLSAAVWQIWHLQSFFKKKKLL